jgi:HlyD family secretion protein
MVAIESTRRRVRGTASEDGLHRNAPTGNQTAADAADQPAQNLRSGALVGRRPVSRPRQTGRLWAVAIAAIVVLVSIALSIRYGRPRAVEQFSASKGAFSIELSGPGTLDAINKAVVSARVQGRLIEILVDRNDAVAQGALIARIASDDLASQLAASVASHEAARRAVLQARADKARTEATLANAQGAHSRQTALLQQGWATQANYDAVLATLRQSEAELARADAAIEAVQAQERAAAATVKVNQAMLDEATVRAPFAGTVVARDRNLGDLVTPGASIVQLVDPSTIVLSARFDESAIASIHPGQAAVLRFVSQPQRPIRGHVLRLGRHVDVETREFTVDVVPDELPANWAIGQRGTAVVTTARHTDVLSVPSRFVARRHGEAGLWVLANGRARWRRVVIGRSGGDLVEIRQGLANGDVVLAPSDLFEWMPVRSPGVP